MRESIVLDGPLDIQLPDGGILRLKPSGRGVAMSLKAPRGTNRAARAGASGKSGRPARPSTLELRAMLAKDLANGTVKEASTYIDWLVAQEPKSKRATLQQTVYREMRTAGAKRGRRKPSQAGGARGRKPNPATNTLRERLAKDQGSGNLRDASYYTKWLVEKVDIGLKQARPIVYRELRAVK